MGDQETPAATNPKMQVMLGVSHSIQGYPKPSISSRNALNWILTKLVRQSCKKEYKILILHVQVPDQDGSDVKTQQRKEEKQGLALLEYFVKQCNEAEVDCEAWLSEGDPKLVICKEAKEKHPDLLVLGSRGLGTIQRIFIGGSSSYCSEHAACPVVIIRRDPDETPYDPMDD
jgi:nucleotide-binding universal stress UspA family protein